MAFVAVALVSLLALDGEDLRICDARLEPFAFARVGASWLTARATHALVDMPFMELWEPGGTVGKPRARQLASDAMGETPAPVRSGPAPSEARAPSLDDHLWARALLARAKAETSDNEHRSMHRKCILIDNDLTSDFFAWSAQLMRNALYVSVSAGVEHPTIVDGAVPSVLLVPQAVASPEDDDGQSLFDAHGKCRGALSWVPPRSGTPVARYAALAEVCSLVISIRPGAGGANSSCLAAAVRAPLVSIAAQPRHLARSDGVGMPYSLGRVKPASFYMFASKMLNRAQPALLVHSRLWTGSGELDDKRLVLAASRVQISVDVIPLPVPPAEGEAGLEHGWQAQMGAELEQIILHGHEQRNGALVCLSSLPATEDDFWALHPEARKSDIRALIVRAEPKSTELRAWAAHVSRAYDQVLVFSAELRHTLLRAGVSVPVEVVPSSSEAAVEKLSGMYAVLAGSAARKDEEQQNVWMPQPRSITPTSTQEA